jgi:hypothetical protein
MCHAVAQPPPPSPSPESMSINYENQEASGPTAGMKYTLNTEPLTWQAARKLCQQQPGGDLVVYESVAEQADVESSFIASGFLDPSIYKTYWLGLWVPTQLVSAWPGFKPVVKQNSSYAHWGVVQPGSRKEPNMLTGPELCALGNVSQAYGNAWGWSDAACAMKTASICKIRECNGWMMHMCG